MNPVLYSSTETEFTTNGIGILTDAVTCTVTEERNGMFELEMQYPMNGIHYENLVPRAIILAKPNPTDDSQPFRIYRITRPLAGIVTVYAEHISYDLAGIPVSPFSASNVSEAFQKLKQYATVPCPFSFWTDKSTVATMNVKVPDSIRGLLGGQQGSVLDTYTGEYKFDRFLVRLYNNRGQNRGVSIRYGKNLTELEQDENASNVYTGVYPYWYSEDEETKDLLELPEKIVKVEGTFNFQRVKPLDLSSEWQEKPTEEQLRNRARKYIEDNNIGVPKLSLDISFAQLEQCEEYKTLALLERVELCDTVNIYYEKLGVNATAKVAKTTFDALLEKYESVELGDVRGSLADTVAEQEENVQQKIDENKTNLQHAVDRATQQITGNLGGYVVIRSSTGGKLPDEILVMDEPEVEQAVKIWRWNKSGLGYSKQGYNGPYTTAITQNGEIVADFITAGTMSANRIYGGILTVGGYGNGNGILRILGDNNNTEIGRWDSDGIKATKGNIAGWEVSETALYKGTSSMTSTSIGTYIGVDGIRQYSGANQYVNIQNGKLTARGVDISGNLSILNGTVDITATLSGVKVRTLISATEGLKFYSDGALIGGIDVSNGEAYLRASKIGNTTDTYIVVNGEYGEKTGMEIKNGNTSLLNLDVFVVKSTGYSAARFNVYNNLFLASYNIGSTTLCTPKGGYNTESKTKLTMQNEVSYELHVNDEHYISQSTTGFSVHLPYNVGLYISQSLFYAQVNSGTTKLDLSVDNARIKLDNDTEFYISQSEAYVRVGNKGFGIRNGVFNSAMTF